jgi:hypothetical protein
MLFRKGLTEGEPERLEESLGEQVSPIRRKISGSEKGDGF